MTQAGRGNTTSRPVRWLDDSGSSRVTPPDCGTLESTAALNAKAETLTDRPDYRNAFLKRRCVIPAEAFYEWVGPKKERQPLNIARKDGKLLSMAGLFNYWKPAASQGRPTLTFTIVTTAPSRWMARIHNRMPVILQDDQVETWLDPTIAEPQKLNELLKAPPEDFLDCYPVSRQINIGSV